MLWLLELQNLPRIWRTNLLFAKFLFFLYKYRTTHGRVMMMIAPNSRACMGGGDDPTRRLYFGEVETPYIQCSVNLICLPKERLPRNYSQNNVKYFSK